MKYAVYQISYTDSDIDAINAEQPNAAYTAKRDMQFDFGGKGIANMAEKAFYEGLYTGVALIEADSLDQVFEIGNMGPESKITRLSRMSSVSVGDLIEDEDGNRHVVASFGFKEVA